MYLNTVLNYIVYRRATLSYKIQFMIEKTNNFEADSFVSTCYRYPGAQGGFQRLVTSPVRKSISILTQMFMETLKNSEKFMQTILNLKVQYKFFEFLNLTRDLIVVNCMVIVLKFGHTFRNLNKYQQILKNFFSHSKSCNKTSKDVHILDYNSMTIIPQERNIIQQMLIYF